MLSTSMARADFLPRFALSSSRTMAMSLPAALVQAQAWVLFAPGTYPASYVPPAN